MRETFTKELFYKFVEKQKLNLEFVLDEDIGEINDEVMKKIDERLIEEIHYYRFMHNYNDTEKLKIEFEKQIWLK